MVGEMRLFSNNGLKKDWKTVIAVKLRQRQCNVKRVGDPSHQQSGYVLRGIVLKFFLIVLKHFDEFSMSLCLTTRGRNTLVKCKCQPTGRDKI